MTPAELQAHAKALVADWPDPTPEQLDRLALLLRPTRRAA